MTKPRRHNCATIINNSRVLTLTDLPDLNAFIPPPPGPAARLTFLGAPGDVAIGGRWRMP